MFIASIFGAKYCYAFLSSVSMIDFPCSNPESGLLKQKKCEVVSYILLKVVERP